MTARGGPARRTAPTLTAAAIQLLLLLFALSVLLPLAWVVFTAFRSSQEIFASPFGLPTRPHWGNFARAWQQAGLARAFGVSLIVTVASLAVLLPSGSMAAYVFARYRFRGSNLIFGLFLAGMMFPLFLTIVPLFFLLNHLGLLDTVTGLVLVYVAYSLPFTVFVMTGFFQSLPGELLEAAMIDGCGHAQAFFRVMLPLARPGLLVVGLFNAIGLWNEYPLALVLITSDINRTLPLGLANLMMVEHYQSDWGALFAGMLIVMVPVLILYWAFRDRVHEVMVAGAVKG